MKHGVTLKTKTTFSLCEDGGISVTIRDATHGLQIMKIKLDAGSKPIVTRAVDAVAELYEPDCYVRAYGMSDAEAFSASTWR